MQVIINLKITFMIDNLSEFFQFGRKAEVASLETESRASLPPLAYRHRENIISQGSFYDWLQYIKAVEKSRNPQADLKETERIYRDLYEKHLRILSKSDARSGLKAFAEDINQRYSPDDTAILLWGYSSEFFYNFMRDKIKPFQVLKYKPRYHTLESSENPGVAVDGAKYDNILFVDDWVLSAAHLGENILSADVLPSKIRPYFLVMSDTGLNICRQNGIDPKFIYRISLIEDDGKTKTGGMSGYPIYGFHKVPDMIPSAFTAKLSGEGKWSIFPRIKGEFIGRDSRLQNKL